MIEEAPWATAASVTGTAIVAILVLLALLWQIAKRRSVRVSVVATVAAAAASMLFFVPVIRDALHDLAGIVDIGRLVAHSSILAAGYAAQMIFVGMIPDLEERRPRQRRLLAILIAGVVTLTMCVLARPSETFDARHATTTAVAVYLTAFLVWLGLSVTGISLAARRRARELAAAPQQGGKASLRYLRLGLRLLAWIGPVGGLYIVNKAVFMYLALAGSPLAGYESYLASPTSQLAVLIAVAGVTVPLLGPPIDSAARTIWAYGAYKRLEPLWRAVAGESTISLPTGFRQVRLRLHQRMAEIHDGLWSLRPWMPGGELPRDPQLAAVAIEEALRARSMAEPTGEVTDEPGRLSERGIVAEAAWLIHVASLLPPTLETA